jgi:hypothetical protein
MAVVKVTTKRIDLSIRGFSLGVRHKHGAISISCLEDVLVGNQILALVEKGTTCKRLSTPNYDEYIAVQSGIIFGKKKGEPVAYLKKNKLLRMKHLIVIQEWTHIHFHIHLLILSDLNT